MKPTKGLAKLSELMCGCASAHRLWGKILTELERCERDEPDGDDDWPAHLCDYAKLTEHGVSVRCAWLTPGGKEALAFLREAGTSFTDTWEIQYDGNGGWEWVANT